MNQSDETWSTNMLEQVSRTFALSISYLPDQHRKQMTIAYLLCRIPDTIEDTDLLSPTEKERLLEMYNHTLQGEQTVKGFVNSVTNSVDKEEAVSKNVDWELVFESERLFQIYRSMTLDEQRVMERWVVELTDGMKDFVTANKERCGVRLETLSELDQYCYYVAGTVGHMIVDLLDITYDMSYEGTEKEEVHNLAENYGLLLQYVNICKDVYDDYYSENNIYIPSSVTDTYGIGQEEFVKTRDGNEQIMDAVISHGEEYMSSAEQFLDWIMEHKRDAYDGWGIPYLLSVATLRELRSNIDLATDETEVKISRDEVNQIVSKVGTVDTAQFKEAILKNKYNT